MESSNNESYLLVINGKPTGPYTIKQLQELKLKPTDFVRTPQMDDYKEAHEVPELRHIFGFQKQVLLQYYGSFDQRLLASALDLFIVSGVCILVAFGISQFVNNRIARFLITFGLLIVIPLANLIYHIVMESGPKQATLGKQLLRIQVCDMQGERLTTAHATGRNIAKILSTLPLFVGYLYSFFNPRRQCFHDIIAGTLVVQGRLVV